MQAHVCGHATLRAAPAHLSSFETHPRLVIDRAALGLNLTTMGVEPATGDPTKDGDGCVSDQGPASWKSDGELAGEEAAGGMAGEEAAGGMAGGEAAGGMAGRAGSGLGVSKGVTAPPRTARLHTSKPSSMPGMCAHYLCIITLQTRSVFSSVIIKTSPITCCPFPPPHS